MADEEKTTVEVGEAKEEEPKKKGGMGKMIMMGGIGVGALLIGVVLTMFLMKPSASEPAAEESHVEEAQHEEPSSSHGEASKEEESGDHGSKPKKRTSHGASTGEGMVYSVRDIIINPAGTGGTRFLSVSFGFELGTAELAEEFDAKEAIVRDALITILSSKTVAQLTDVKQKEIARYQIKKRLEQLLETDQIEGVYYTDFVLQ